MNVPLFVAVLGKIGIGKSSLVNSLFGERLEEGTGRLICAGSETT